MRVIGGEAKGRRLKMVRGTTTRPISDRVKEALFSILGERVEEARFLDLFAGTGSVGIEALSRGAAWAVFVEQQRQAIFTIKDNLEQTGLKDRAQVVRSDVFAFLGKEGLEPFDVVYVAPPQYRQLWAKTVQVLDGSVLLGSESVVVAQIHPKEYADLKLEALELVDRRKYGSTMLCFYLAA